MSKKKNLSKAIALSLLFSLPCTGAVFANVDGADGADLTIESTINSTGLIINNSAPAGTNGGTSAPSWFDGSGGRGGSTTSNYTAPVNITNTVDITSTGGDGGNSRGLFAGGNGGNAETTLQTTNPGSYSITAKDLFITAIGGKGGDGGSAYYDSGSGGIGGAAKAYGLKNLSNTTSIIVDIINVTASGGDGGRGLLSGDYGNVVFRSSGNGGDAGSAEAYGVYSSSLDSMNIIATDIKTFAFGGIGGSSDNSLFSASYGTAGQGGKAIATGIYGDNMAKLDIIADYIITDALAGNNGIGATKNVLSGTKGSDALAYGIHTNDVAQLAVNTDTLTVLAIAGGSYDASIRQSSFDVTNGSAGGLATATGIKTVSGDLQITAKNLNITSTGGFAGNGESAYSDAGAGGVGGAAEAYGISSLANTGMINISQIAVEANGGLGGAGGSAGFLGNNGNGGAGGNGGDATVYGVRTSDSSLTLITDRIMTAATGGVGGAFGLGNGAGTVNGSVGAQGKATSYSIYSTTNASTNIYSNSNSLNIGTSAIGSTQKAYSLYAEDNSKILFGTNATMNQDKNFNTDNSVISYVSNSTLGFADTLTPTQAVGRTVTGGELQLVNSNTFRFATDLKNNGADKFVFDSLAAGSTVAPQYITVAYDKSFDGVNNDSIAGTSTVMRFTNINGNDLSQFVGQAVKLDNALNRFIATPTVVINGNDVNITQIEFVDDGPSETIMASSDAHLSIRNLWRIETSDLMTRMGELRNDSETGKGGVWARYYRGKLGVNDAYNRNLSQTYTGFQGGFDSVRKYKNGKLVTGLLLNHIDSTASYYVASGDLSSTGFGVYTSWFGNKGHYLDIVARASKLSNNFKLTDNSGNIANGDYSTWGYALSTEYGYRQQLQAGWFVEPQAQLTFSHIKSSEYTMNNNVQVKQNAINSTVARIGILSGKAFTANGRAGNVYLKASLMHEFGGNGAGIGYYQNNNMSILSGDLGSTWFEFGVGGNIALSKNANFYFDTIKTLGGKLKTNWQINAGVRIGF